MCGVIAYRNALPEPEDYEALGRLLRESQVRGVHAFGLSWKQSPASPIQTRKFRWVEQALDFIAGDLRRIRPQMVIGHNRYSTSGDYLVEANNQPIELPEFRVAMAFNGVIDQSPEGEWPGRYGCEFVTQNDGEIAVRKWLQGREQFLPWFRSQSFSFAGSFLDGSGVWVIRNKQRPLWFHSVRGSTFVASTADIFRRAGFDNPESLKPMELINI